MKAKVELFIAAYYEEGSEDYHLLTDEEYAKEFAKILQDSVSAHSFGQIQLYKTKEEEFADRVPDSQGEYKRIKITVERVD